MTTVQTDTPAQEPAVLTNDQMKAIWNEEAAKRAPGYKPPEQTAADDVLGADPAVEQDPNATVTPAASSKDDKLPATVQTDEDPVAKRFDAMEQQLKRAEGRISSMQKAAAEAAKQAVVAGDKAPTSAVQAAALKNPEKWAALRKEFPEWGDATEELLRANLAQPGPAQLSEEQVNQRVASALQTREIARVERKHPGWLDTIKTDEFTAWKAAQSDEVKALGASDFAEDAIDMIDLFVKRTPTKAAVQQQRSTRLAAAAATPRVARPVATARDDGELTQKEIWAQEADRRAKAKQAANA